MRSLRCGTWVEGRVPRGGGGILEGKDLSGGWDVGDREVK